MGAGRRGRGWSAKRDDGMTVTRSASHGPEGRGQEWNGRPAARPGHAPPSSDRAREAVAAVVRPLRRWLQQAGRALGVRRTFEAGGVVYRELSAEPLGRALGKNGRGYKAFEVVFADGSRQVIRATAQRVYADLVS